MDQEQLQELLIKITQMGMSVTAIAKATGILKTDLSRFKNGRILLNRENASALECYLNKIYIPESN